MNKYIIIIGICILIWSSVGCVNDEPSTFHAYNISSEGIQTTTFHTHNESDRIVSTIIEIDGLTTTYTGLIIEVSYVNGVSSDFILFHDGELVPCVFLENHNLKLGQMNKITIKDTALYNKKVISIEQI